MKQISTLLITCLLSMSTVTELLAGPRSISNTGKDYIIGVVRPSNWSCGAYFEMRERDVSVRNQRWNQSLNADAAGVHVGYEFQRWLTAYGILGSTKSELEGADYKPPQSEYGIGVRLGIIDQEILDPTLFEDRLRINAFLQYTENKSEDLAWQEISGAVTLAIVNDIHGYKNYVPNCITLFAGPAFSDMRGNVNEVENVGLLVGSDIFLTRKVSAYIQMISWGDNNSNTTGLGVNVSF